MMEKDFTNTQVQIIDENGNLMPDFKTRFKELGLAKFGKDYHTVSIIGNQSTGKSTLLNKLFGTTFNVMDARLIRKQTTQGILVSRDKEKNILVFDVEGADSKERWDGHEPFEQCTAFFSLVLSQVLMINVWTKEVGRFAGSNYGILKVIFENNLKLFKQEGPKKLIFILRDTDDSENLEVIKNTIRLDMSKIWAEIVKPREYIASRPEEFFEFEFIFLSSYKWARNVFEQQTDQLRQRFRDSYRNDYFFKHHDTKSNVPIDGLYLFMENVWSTIKNCKDINLPSQRTLVANLRCTDIKNEIITSLQSEINNLKVKASKSIYEKFGLEGELIILKALKDYENQTENYDKPVVAEKRRELVSGLLRTLHEAFEKQVSILRKNTIADLNSQLNEIKINPENLGNLMEKAKKVQNDAVFHFQESITRLVIPGSEWNLNIVLSEVHQQIDDIIAMFKEKQLAFVLKHKATQIRRELEARNIKLFNNLNNDFWVVLDNFYNETLRNAESFIKNMLSDSFELSSDLVRNQIKILNEDTYKDLSVDLENRFQELQYFMLKKFRIIFGKNENNVPINWKTLKPEEIEARYVHSKRICMDILENLRYFGIRKRGQDYLEKRPVLSEKEYETIIERLNDDFEHEFKDAERKRAANEMGYIPKWFWFILIFFMYDDVFRWIKSPLILGMIFYPLFLLLCIIGLVFATGILKVIQVITEKGYGSSLGTVCSGVFALIRMFLRPKLRQFGINL